MLRFYVSSKTRSFAFTHPSGPLVMGRLPGDGVDQVVDDPYLSKKQLSVEELPSETIRVRNLSTRVVIHAGRGNVIAAGDTETLPLPARLSVGTTRIAIDSGPDEPQGGSLETIARPVTGSVARQTERDGPILRLLQSGLDASQDLEGLFESFETLVQLQTGAAGSAAFYQELADAIVKSVGFDRGLFLLRKGDDWDPVATSPATETVGYSRAVLDRVRQERRTYYQAKAVPDASGSLAGVRAVVASPVLDQAGDEVVGTLYGVRLHAQPRLGPEIRPVQAKFVQLLATAAGAGIARLHREAEAARGRVQFEQFFGHEMAVELGRDRTLLDGRECEVTILVCDVRKFSTIAGRIGPRTTCDLMGDILERMTAKIHEHGGVVVDYAGDGILAMWNAPVPQADHVARACHAAMAMLDELPALNTTWQERVGQPIALGIGINTGDALVGNTGSRQRMKYGPLGNTVNLASRVEGATKALGVPVLITGATQANLRDAFATRRIAKVRLIGIEQPLDLYELGGVSPAPEWLRKREAYERALESFERGRLLEACRSLDPILGPAEEAHLDKPALTLAARAIDGLRTGGFDPVITLESK